METIATDQNMEREINLSDYLDVLYKRKSVVVSFFLLTITTVLLGTFLMKPVFEARSQMVIDREQTASPLTGERVDYESLSSETLTFNTHFKLIKSNAVLSRVIEQLDLDDGAVGEGLEITLAQKLVKQFKKNIRLLLKKDKVLLPQEKREILLQKLRSKIVIKEERNTRILNIFVKDTDPERARNIANVLSKQYIAFNMSSKMSSSTDTLEWMNNELYSLKKRLEDDEKKFLEYKQKYKFFSIEGKQKIIDQKIREFNNEYLIARNKRSEIDTKLAELDKILRDKQDLIHIRSLLDNNLIENIYDKMTELELEYSRLSKVFKSKHPEMIQITSKIRKTRMKLNDELKKELENLKTRRTVLLKKEEQMSNNIKEFEADAIVTSSKEMEYSMLRRNVATSQKLYDIMLGRIKESNISQTNDASNIRIIDQATLPVYPVKPNKKLNLLLAIVLGLFGGIGLAFFLEYMDQTINTEEDVQACIGLPVLAVIPIADKNDTKGSY